MITAIILAGGNSTRMGSDKASLLFKGERFIDRLISITGEFADDVLVVSDRKYDGLSHCRQISDLVKNAGPLGGLCTGLYHSVTMRNLVLSCDVPLFTHEILDKLLSKDHEKYDVVLPEKDGNLMPLVALYKKRSLAILEEELDSGRLKLTDAIKKLNYCPIELNKILNEQLANINTKEDYNSLVQ